MMCEIVSADAARRACDGARHHVLSAHLLPIVDDGGHGGPLRVVGHGAVVAHVVDIDLAVVKLHDHRSSRGIGDAPVERRHGATVECGASDAEIVGFKHFDTLSRGGVHIEQPSHEHSERHGGAPLGVGIVVDRALAEKAVDHQAHLVHTLSDAAVIAHGVDSAIFRGPAHGTRFV